ncbi:SAV_2336 N-terminal domain-related protein [Amycolatopsis sp. NPDC003731]
MSEPDDAPTAVPADELSWRDVADGLWLAHLLRPPDRPGQPDDRPPDRPPAPKRVAPPPSEPVEPAAVESVPATAGMVPVPDAVAARPGQDGGDRAFESQLTDPRAIERALRPLSRRVPSRRDSELDEVRVATNAAETGLWLPVTRPAATRWFDVVVVCDTGRSAELWRATAAHFVRLLEHQGAFRDVRTVQIDTDQDIPDGYQVAGRSDRRPLRDLADPRGRRIVLVLTDGMGRAWRPDAVASWLAVLGEDNPLAVVHHLPPRLWRLGNLTTELANLSAREPGTPNRRLRFDLYAESGAPRREGLPVPVLEMSGRWLARWAGLLTATGPPEVTLPVALLGRSSGAPEDLSAELSAHERVRAFHLTASPAAFRLAALLSAVPIDLAVMRFVQREMVPRSALFHLAEVLHGGLLTDEPGAGLDFRPGVRAELLGALRRAETVGVIRDVGTAFGAARPAIARLRAAVTDPFAPSLPSEPADIGLEHAVMRALSGPYLSRADRLAAGPESLSGMAMPRTAAQSDGSETMAVLSETPQAGAQDFVERPELAALRSSLADGDGRPVVVLGEGGSGKTELVRGYLARHADDYDSAWWVRAGAAADIVTGYGGIAIELGLKPHGAGADAAAAAVLDAFAGARAVRWLLVLDGASDPGDVLPYLPAGPAHVVVTSREPAWSDHGIPVPLGRLSAAQSRELLQGRAPSLGDAECESLAELHGGLAATVAYLAHRAPRRRFAAGWFTREMTDDGLFRRALEAVAGSRPLLDICAVVGPRGVSTNFLRRLSDLGPDPGAGGVAVPELDEARTALLDAGLLVPDRDVLVVPEPVRSEVLARSEETALDSARHAVHRVLAEDTSTLPPGEVVSHLRHSGMANCADPRVRSGVADLTRRLLELGYLAGAIEVAETVLLSWEGESASGTPEFGRLAAELGVAYRLRGDRVRAVRLHRSHGPAVALARSLRETGEIDAAFEALGGHALPPSTEDMVVAAEFAATARVAAALAGRPLAAEVGALQEEVVARLRQHGDDWHPATLAASGDLALTRRLCGETRQALDLDRTLLGRASALLGEGHPITLACAINFATDLHEIGDHEAAAKLDRRTARIAARAQGARHTATLVARWNLALDEGPESAEAAARTALSRELGRSHPLAVLAAAGSRCWYEPDPGTVPAGSL